MCFYEKDIGNHKMNADYQCNDCEHHTIIGDVEGVHFHTCEKRVHPLTPGNGWI